MRLWWMSFQRERPMARTTSPVQLEQFQLSEKAHAITVTDEDGVAIDLTGKTLRLVVFDENKPPVGAFQITESDIVIGSGENTNVATVTVDATASANASEHYRWILWSTTDDMALANGAFTIWAAVKSVA